MSLPLQVKSGSKLNYFQQNALQAGFNPKVSMIGFILSWIVFFVIQRFVPITDEFSVQARSVLAITAWVMIVWVSEALPKGISGLMIPVLLILTGVFSKAADAFSGFTSDAAFLCLGAFVLASVTQAVGLDKRIASTILLKVKPKIPNVLSGLFAAHVLSALFVPSTAARSSMFLPAVQGINEMFGQGEKGRNVRRALAMAGIGFGAVFAAPIFLTGHMPNVIIVGLLKSNLGTDIGWGTWCWLHYPMLGLIPIMWWWVVHHFDLRGVEAPGGIHKITEENKKLGPISQAEKILFGLFLLAILLWSTENLHNLNAGIVTLIVIGIIFIPGLLPIHWKKVQDKVIWGTWLLIAGALSLVTAFSKTGLDKFLAEKLVDLVPPMGWLGTLLFIMLLVQILRLGIISNVFAVTLMGPVVLAMAPMLGLNPVAFTLAVLNVDTFALIIPMQVAACLIAYASDEFSFVDFIKAGTPLTLIAILYIAIVMVPWWALNGYPIWVS